VNKPVGYFMLVLSGTEGRFLPYIHTRLDFEPELKMGTLTGARALAAVIGRTSSSHAIYEFTPDGAPVRAWSFDYTDSTPRDIP
jgi:hypothetical protein